MIYPEHEKLQKIKDQSQAIGEFLEWLRYTKDYRICIYDPNDYDHYIPVFTSTNDLLAEYFDIDQNKLESEKQEILEELRKQQ